jgi:glycerol kinase
VPDPLLLAVDQGTTGTTALLLTPGGVARRRTYRPVRVRFPREGWVEQDAEELWSSVLIAVQELLADGDRPAALGITNQRETLVVFDRRSLEPVAPAIVWQCRRSAAICEEHRARGEEAELRRRTGLLLDPYFTATKLEWLLREQPELRSRAERGELCASTVDGWLIARLTAGSVLATDASNASRTLLFDLTNGDFSDELCSCFSIPRRMLPEVCDSSGRLAVTDARAFLGLSLPVNGVAGDQQAALFGQACLRQGMTKNTYGTGSFVLTNIGSTVPAPVHGLLTTLAWRLAGRDTYALEGSVFVTGAALAWLRDGLGVIADVAEAGPLFDSVADSHGSWFVPALSGLGAPWWDPQARGALLGLTAGVTRAHVVRAVVEAMAYRTRDVIEAMEKAAGLAVAELRVDGGASVMDGLCQFQADLLGIPVARAASSEATAVGAGLLAALGEGMLDGLDAVADGWQAGRRFEPATPGERPMSQYAEWLGALRRARGSGSDDVARS